MVDTKIILWMILVTNLFGIMKKAFYFFAIAALACATACQREVLPEAEAPVNETTFRFISAKPVLEEETSTRTEWTGETIQWSQNDQIRMAYTVEGEWQGASDENTAPKLYASNKLAEAAEVAEFTVNSSFTSTATGTHIFYGLYPGTLVSSTNFNDAPVADINLPSEQTPAADSFDGAADVMIGVSEELAAKPSSEETVLMSWTRLVAHADLTIKNLAINEGETIDNVTLTAQDGADLVGMHRLNLVTGEVSNPQGATNEIVIKAENLTYANNTIKVWASMLPATLTELTVTVETDKAFYVRSFSGFSREFKKNKHNTMNIGMTSAVRTEKAADLEDYEESFNNTFGDFTVQKQVLSEGLTYVWATNSGYAKASAYKSGKPYAATSYLVSPALTIGSDKSKLTFEHAANYLNGGAFDENFYVVVFEGDSEEVLTLDVKPSGNSWTFVTATVSLSKYNGKTIQIGFKYTSTDQLAGTWEVKNFKVTDVKAPEAPTEYTITVEESENGAVSASADKAVEGTEITLTVTPESGYVLDELSVVDAENNPVTVTDDYKFVMPASNVTVSATFEELTGDVYDFTWDLTKATYSSASTDQVKWQNANVTMTADKAGASTNANNYLPPSQTSTRFYKSSTLTFTPATGVTITKVEYTATTASYATALGSSTWTNASAAVSETLVTITPTDGSKAFSATLGGTTGASAVKVYYLGGSPVVETEYTITINGTTNGAVTASADKATQGTEITLTVTPATGYELDVLSVKDAENNDVAVNNFKFSMPASNVTVSATFKEKEAGSYVLDPIAGSNNNYASNCDITIDGITWNVTGNATMVPWRIGGKNLSEVDREVYSKTALDMNVETIAITHGNASGITVHSMTVIVASDANFNNVVSTLTPEFEANATVSVARPAGADWSNCYYKFVYNVSAGSNNKFLEFSKAVFTGE